MESIEKEAISSSPSSEGQDQKQKERKKKKIFLGLFKCHLCPREFKLKGYYEKHIKNYHENTIARYKYNLIIINVFDSNLFSLAAT
jgi:hypothetical protein